MSPTAWGTIAATRSPPTGRGQSAGSPRSSSRRACAGPSSGIARTSGGGGRSAPASTASTTSASTGGPCVSGALREVPLMPRRFETSLDGLVLIEPDVHGDDRGFLLETFRDDQWGGLGIDLRPVQENHSRSAQNTLRGLHFQTSPGQ